MIMKSARPLTHWLLLAGFLTLSLTAGGCGVISDPLSKANYEKIRVGMSRSDVEKILGKPSQEQKHEVLDATELKWGDDQRYIKVTINQKDKVAKFDQEGVIGK
jgi:hypothetical protein